METISCTVCKSDNYRVIYPERIDERDLNFSPRRTPSKTHHRIVECNKCGLVYSNPIIREDKILNLYKTCKFEDEAQVELMAQDYLDQLKKAVRHTGSSGGGPASGGKKGNLLEIGCGNGAFLEKAREFGFQNVRGVEPCADAVRQAVPSIRENIINDTFREGLYENDLFDLICVIQTFDHLINPAAALLNMRKVLKRGGYILAISHNVRFFLTKVLGERSPVFDIEHICLFDKSTIKKLLEDNGFEVIYVEDILSRYTLKHAVTFFPLPGYIKRFAYTALKALGIENVRIKIMNGNMAALARKI